MIDASHLKELLAEVCTAVISILYDLTPILCVCVAKVDGYVGRYVSSYVVMCGLTGNDVGM